MLRGMSIAESGLLAATKRLHAAANNIANAGATGRLPTSPSAPAGPAPYTPVTVEQSSNATGGVIAQSVPASEPYVATYDPSAPYADANGMIGTPNVDLAREATDLISVRQDFLANAEVLRVTDEMLKRLYELADHDG